MIKKKKETPQGWVTRRELQEEIAGLAAMFKRAFDELRQDMADFKKEIREEISLFREEVNFKIDSIHRRIDVESLNSVKQHQHQALEKRVKVLEKKVRA